MIVVEILYLMSILYHEEILHYNLRKVYDFPSLFENRMSEFMKMEIRNVWFYSIQVSGVVVTGGPSYSTEVIMR